MRRIYLLLVLTALIFTVPNVRGQTTSIINGTGQPGLPPDAAIRSVTFSLEGGSFVTNFQVQGSISSAYGYTIDLKVQSANYEPDYMITYNYAQVGAGAYFVDVKTNKITPITTSTISGNSWTVSIPFSLINNLTDFWAGATTLQVQSWGTQMIDGAPSNSSPGHLQFAEINLGTPSPEFPNGSSVIVAIGIILALAIVKRSPNR